MKMMVGNNRAYWYALGIMVFLFFCFYATDGNATNHLASLKTDVKDTFGAESDVPKYILLGEGVVGAVSYAKTKNMMVLAGLPILMVFTHYSLAQL